MSIYLGNTEIGNGNYLGNLNIRDSNIFMSQSVATTTTTTSTTTTSTTTTSTTTTTTFAPSNVYRCVGCCDSASYYIRWTATGVYATAIPNVIYNTFVGQCMTVTQNVASQSVNFTISNDNADTYVYGTAQCANCIASGHPC
jgi:hypothetical protein